MRRINLLLLVILAIGCIVPMALADPGAITNTVIQDLEALGFASVSVEVEVALEPTLLRYEPAANASSFDFSEQELPECVSGQVYQVLSMPIAGDGFRALECRSLHCT